MTIIQREQGSQRKRIRLAVVDRLTNRTAAKANVFDSRLVPFWPDDGPLVAVYARDEGSQVITTSPRERRRRLRLAIEVRFQGKNLENILDEVADEIERIMDEDPGISGTATNSNLEETAISVDADGDSPVGAARLTYEVTYFH